MGRVFALKNVRIFYTKTDRMKFVSHLDMNRLMTRIIRKSGIPVWYTEGFNCHIYINYAVPLSLGFEGIYEIMDIRITEDSYSADTVLEKLNSVSVDGISFFRAAEPVLPTKDITYAEYELCFEKDGISDKLKDFLSRESVICFKKDKKGRIKELDIIPKIKKIELDGSRILLTLTAGNEGNLNPSLILNTFFEQTKEEPCFCAVKRLMLFDGEGKEFI